MFPKKRQDANARVAAEAERELNAAMRNVGSEMNEPRTDTPRPDTGRKAPDTTSADQLTQAELDDAIAAARREHGFDPEAGEQIAPAHMQAECPSCGRIYEMVRACPVDGTQLRPIGRWEPVAETTDPDEVYELAARHYPTQER